MTSSFIYVFANVLKYGMDLYTGFGGRSGGRGDRGGRSGGRGGRGGRSSAPLVGTGKKMTFDD